MEIREKKELTVKSIKEKFDNAKGVILTDYRGLSVKEISELRTELRKSGIEYKIYKNTLTKIAIEKNNYEGIDDYLEGPSAFAFDFESEIGAAKALSDYAKKQKKLVIKAGIIEGKVIDPNAIKEYASLPSREELLAKILGTFNAPVQQIVTVLAAPLQGFMNVLKAKAEQG